jgi:hypothetical protein
MFKIKYLRKSYRKIFSYYFLVLISGGFFFLVCKWFKKLEIFFFFIETKIFTKEDYFGQKLYIKVESIDN